MLRRLIAGCLGSAVLSAAGSAEAHAIETSLEAFRNNHVLLLQSSFGNGEPAQAALVSLVPPGGEPIPVGRTNSKGQLSFALPRDAHGEWDVKVDGGPGHRDYLSLPINRGQADLNRISDGLRPPPPDRLSAWLIAWPLVGAVGGLMGGCTALLLGRHRRRLP